MIKFYTLGGLNKSINSPVLTFGSDVANYTFKTVDGKVYLISAQVEGDQAYAEGYVIKAGEKARGFYVPAMAGFELVVDEKHITYGVGESYASITAGTTLFTIDGNGKLAIAAEAPASGVYFKAVEKCRLTEKAVKVEVIAVDAAGTDGATTLAGLTDVDTTGATSGQVLKYNGTKWAPAADATE